MAPKSGLTFDYSKWDRLEISDDEETFHPNLDKNLNVRVNRMTRERKEEEVDAEVKAHVEAGRKDLADKADKKRPLHEGNLCKVGDERTIINWSQGGKTDRINKDGEEFSVDEYTAFKNEHEKLLLEFVDADWEKSHKMLRERGDVLMDENANSYYLLTTLDAEMKGDLKKVDKLCRQGQIISQIFQLAKPMNRPPRDLVNRFFERFESGDSQAAFQEGVDHFKKHIKARAIQKKEEEANMAAEEEGGDEEPQVVSLVEAMYDMKPEERMGPGGLDPVEVFESLPLELQECFRSGDVERLKKYAGEAEPEEFEAQFKRCVDSGLWKSG